MPISYSDALKRHDRSRAFGDPRDFQTFAREMEEVQPGEGFGEAASRDGWWTRASTRADQYVFEPVAEYTTKPIGGAIGELFGRRDIGEEIGKSLPRTLLETAPLYLIPGAGPAATAAKLASVAALMGSHTYADTGSPAAAAISGAAGALTPGFGNVFGKLGARAAGGTRLTGTIGGKVFDDIVPEAAKDYAKVTSSRYIASQFGMLIPNSAASLAQQKLMNPDAPIDWEQFGVETAVSQIPFTVFDVVKMAKTPKHTAATIRPALDKPQAKVADYVPPVGSAEEQAQMEAVFAQLENVITNEAATPQEREAALSAAISTSNDPKAVIGLKRKTPVTDEPVTITGLGRKQANGNWKVLVEDVQTAAALGVEPGQTVFVNGAEPTATEDGKMSWEVTSKKVNKNVSSPLKPEHFGFVEDPNQPRLPDQPVEWSGFAPDEVETLKANGVEPIEVIRAAALQYADGSVVEGNTHAEAFTKAEELGLEPKGTGADTIVTGRKSGFVTSKGRFVSDREAARIHGVDTPALDSTQLNDPIGITETLAELTRRNAPLIPIAHAMEEASGKLAETQQKIETVPTRAEEIPEIINVTEPGLHSSDVSDPFGRLESLQNPKYNPLGLLAAARNPDGSIVTARVHAELVGGLQVGNEIGWKTKDGRFLTREEAQNEVTKHKIEQGIKQGSTPTQAVEKVRLQTQTPVVDSLQQQLSILKEQAKTITEFHGKPQNQYGKGIRDENGKNFTSRLEAETHLADLQSQSPEDKTEYVIRDAGKGKGFYIAPVINREVSLEGTGLVDVLATPEVEDTFIAGPITPEQTQVGIQGLLRQLDVAGRNVGEFAKFLEHRDPVRALEELKTYRQYLQDAMTGKEPVTTRAQDARRKEISLALLESREALQKFRLRHINFTLASEMPHDVELVKQIGFDESVPLEQRLDRALDYFVAQKDSGVFGVLMTDLRKAVDLSKIRLTNDFREGFYYENDVINVPYLPNKQNYGIWSNSLNHEIAHHATVDALRRTDPAAMRFKVTVQQALEALDASPMIPKEVRGIMKEFRGMYEEYRKNADSRAFNEKWRAKVGAAHDEWLDVVYGLQNPNELIAQMFSSPKMVEVMRVTKMPKTVGQTVMQFFSKAWNAVFSGKVETDDVFGQILSSFDNYLSGVRIRPTREGIVRAPQAMYNGRDYLRDALVAEGVRPEGLASRMQTVEQVFKTGDLLNSIEGYEREANAGLLPATAEKNNLFVLSQTKILDNLGAPLRLYHGTNRVFTEFDINKTENILAGAGLHFTDSPEIASKYALGDTFNENRFGQGNPNVHPVYLNLKNPATPEIVSVVRQEVGVGDKWNSESEIKIKKELELRGFDGLIYDYAGGKVYVAFRSNQIIPAFSKEGLAASLEGTQRLQARQDYITNKSGTDANVLASQEPSRWLQIETEFKKSLPTLQTKTNEIVKPEIRDSLSKLPADVGTATMNLLADSVPIHQELWNRMREDVTIAKDLYINIKKGLVPGKLPEGVVEKIQYAQVKLNAMKKALDKQANAIERFNDLNNFTYDGIESTMASQLTNRRLPAPPDPTGVQDIAQGLMGMAEIRQKTSLEELHGVNQIGPITRNLMLTQHVKKLFPAFAPVANHVREHIGRAIDRITTLNLSYAWDYNTNSLSKNVAKSNMRVAQNERLTSASSNIKRFANIQEGKKKDWSWNDPEVQKELSKFNQTDRDAIKLEFDSERARHAVWTEQTLPQALTQINRESTAKVIAAYNVGMLPDTARDLSQQVYDAVAMFSDPAQSVVAVEMMRDLATKMQPHVLKAALTHAQGSVADVNKHIEFMRSRPSYVSEQRYDAHHLVMVGSDGKQFRVSRKTKEELVNIQTNEERKGAKFVEYIPKADANTPAGGVNSEILDSMRELDVQSYNRTKIALEGVDPQIATTILSETQRTAQYESSANAFKPVPGVTRRFVAGREYINMIENAHEFYVRGNNWLRHRLTDATTSLDMMHPEVAGNRTLKQYADQHVQNSLTPDNPFFRKLVEATHFQRLAFSVGNSALEGVQNLTTGMQAVISETGSIGDAFRLWGGAIKTLMQTRLSNKWGDPDLQWAMDKAARLGARGMAHWNDIIDPDRDTVFTINQQRMNVPKKGFTAVQYGARKWATLFQRYNDNIGMITGFRLGLEKGMTKEQAFDFAWDLKERGYYSGGKAQRPVGLWSIKTKPVPQMLSALQTYTLGWFSQMSTDWKVGFGGHAPGEFTATQRQGAKKAFLYGLASQAVLAGALGLPGVGQGMSLLKQATGIDLKGQLRGTLAQLFDEDTENGGMLTNLALRGGLSGVSPIDPSNRAAVSFPFVGVDPYKGFDLSSLFGASGATVSDAVQGLLAAGRGDFVGFQKLLPSVLRPGMGLIQGEGDVRDRRGTLLQTLSPAERFVTAIGLPSSRIQSARDTAEAVKNLNDAAQQQHQRFVDQLAEKVRTGRLQEVQQDLQQHKKENPQVDLRHLVRSISGRVEAQTVPYDYRRDLNVAADLRGFGSRMPSTEVDRLRMRRGVEESLGLRAQPNFREEQRASQIDTLLNSDPYQSRGRAVRQLETLKRQRRSDALYFPESQ